jgi:hypothetical protein
MRYRGGLSKDKKDLLVVTEMVLGTCIM